jgi:tetratricopeptide (TPR) repeat protein
MAIGEARPDDAFAQLERAQAALLAGRNDEAVEAATAAVAASNGSVEARLVLGRAQLKSGRVDDALATVRSALERDSLNPALYLLLGACAAARGSLSDAVAGWERYVRLAPNAADTSRVRAVAEAAVRLRDALKELGDV